MVVEQESERRWVPVPRTGARVCLMIAALFLVAAVYMLLTPLQGVGPTAGRPIECGTAIDHGQQFAKAFCGTLNQHQTDKAIALFVAALIVAVGGFLSFGLEHREETARGTGRRVANSDV